MSNPTPEALAAAPSVTDYRRKKWEDMTYLEQELMKSEGTLACYQEACMLGKEEIKRLALQRDIAQASSELLLAERDQLKQERDQLARWKKEALTVESWWSEIDAFVRKHPDAPLSQQVSAIALKWLQERDGLREKLEAMNALATQEGWNTPLFKPEFGLALREARKVLTQPTAGKSENNL